MHKYLNPRNYARQAFMIANQHLLARIEAFIAPSPALPLSQPPIFIIGPPRSGSTIVMQVITDAFDIGYISNRHCRWYGAPALAEKLFDPLANRPQSDYQSSHGVANGFYAPSECGAWWYRFFRRCPAYVTEGDVDQKKMNAFRRSIAAFGRASARPLLFKNLYASLRLEPIAKILPEAIFLVVERSWVDNGHSILCGRKKATGRYDIWWSVPPPDVDELTELSPVGQVVGQISSIHNLINRDIEQLGLKDRTFRIRYEDFCEDVRGTLDKFETFLSRQGVKLKPRFEVPTRFDAGHRIKIPHAMYEELVTEVCEKNDKSGQSGVARQ